MRTSLISLIIFLFVVTACSYSVDSLELDMVVPTKQQIAYQEMEVIGFIHFSINTFTDKEWGYGDKSPEIFNPSELDAEQWARTAKEAGMKQLILTAKHHDGFCLWPSAYTEHSVKNSPWKDGHGDVIREFVDACAKYGLKAGLYLSPWDRNHKDYGTSEYLPYYRNQLTELLTNYGVISEIWFDGANGGDGYYGGANESRKIDRETYYDWDSTFKLVYKLQPDIIIFSDAGPGCRWIGNEHGIAGETNWSTIKGDSLIIGASKQSYLNTGDPDGDDWIVGECDVSIRPGWFYHESQDDEVKSLERFKEIYYGSVGRNGVLLLNIPPDKRGLIHENDVARLQEFGHFINSTFDDNLAGDASISVEEDSVYTMNIQLPEERTFNLLVLGEDIAKGQRVKAFRVEALLEKQWITIAEGTTVGYKRILRVDSIKASKFRLIILDSFGDPLITNFGLFLEGTPFPLNQ